jgi:hypothetical protein
MRAPPRAPCDYLGAMSPKAPRRLSRVLLTLVLLVPALLVLWWLSSRPKPVRSSFDEALDRALAPVMEQREVHEKLRAAGPAQARPLARELALDSVPYLAPRDLELWASTRERVARSSRPACASLWKGSDDVAIGRAIAALGPEVLQPYVEMLARGFALRLERKPPPQPSPGAIERGFAAASAALPEEARAAFAADSRRSDVTDERACELFLAVSQAATGLEPAQRVDFLRALAAQLKPLR